MDFFIIVLQVITLILFIPVLVKLFFSEDIKEGIIGYLKEKFEFLQHKIDKIYEYEMAEFSKAETSNLETNLSQVTLNHIINLSDFEIFYFTPYDGYLSIECEYCELHFLDNNQIIVKKYLNNFFFEARKTISIRNIKNLKNIRFDRKNKK